MLKQLYALWQWLSVATALPTRDELDAELDRLSPPPSWPVKNPCPGFGCGSIAHRMDPLTDEYECIGPMPPLPSGPPDTTEGDEPTRLSEPSPAPVPHPAAHDAPAARGCSAFQPHIAKGQ